MVALDEIEQTIVRMRNELAGCVRERHRVLLEFRSKLWDLENPITIDAISTLL